MSIYKLKAFGWHLVASLVVATVSLLIVLHVWYPLPLYQATGVGKIFSVMLGVGIVLGPVLTFIVYRPKKKTLKFDLSVIVLLQLTAFFYGFYHVYDGRPVWIAYNVDRFDLVKNNELDSRKLSETKTYYRSASNTGPKYVAAIIPNDNRRTGNDILFDEIGYGIAPSQRPELYQPISTVNDTIDARSEDLNKLYDYNNSDEVDNVLAEYSKADSFLPLKASTLDMVVLINKKDSPRVIEIVDLRPW